MGIAAGTRNSIYVNVCCNHKLSDRGIIQMEGRCMITILRFCLISIVCKGRCQMSSWAASSWSKYFSSHTPWLVSIYTFLSSKWRYYQSLSTASFWSHASDRHKRISSNHSIIGWSSFWWVDGVDVMLGSKKTAGRWSFLLGPSQYRSWSPVSPVYDDTLIKQLLQG